MGPEGRAPRSVGSVMAGLMRRGAPLARTHARIEKARRAWCIAAGEELAGHTRVASLRTGTLTVEVDSAPLCHSLAAFERDRLLAKVLEAAQGVEVHSLRFRHGAF